MIINLQQFCIYFQERLQDFEAEDEAIYHNPNLGDLHEGVSFTVTGKTKRHCERYLELLYVYFICTHIF